MRVSVFKGDLGYLAGGSTPIAVPTPVRAQSSSSLRASQAPAAVVRSPRDTLRAALEIALVSAATPGQGTA